MIVPGEEMMKKTDSQIIRSLLICAGFAALAAGVVGIFVPVLPTVPLLLLAAACFARSSDRFHRWLLNHQRLGPMIAPFLDGRGIPKHAKIKAIALLWASLLVSVVFLIPIAWVDLLVLGIGVAVSVYLLRLPDRVPAGG